MLVFLKKAIHAIKKILPKRSSYGKFSASKIVGGKVNIIIWNSEEGKELLLSTPYNQAFFRLAHTYQPQINPFYCSIACMTMCLNALRLDKGKVPHQEGFGFTKPDGEDIVFHIYSQLTLLNEETEIVKKKIHIAPSIFKHERELGMHENEEDVYDPGLELDQVKSVLELYGVLGDVKHAIFDQHKGAELLRKDIRNFINSENAFIVVNFECATLGLQDKGGHYSLVGAYNQSIDSVLLLDLAAHKNPWYWVPVKDLYQAMHTKDHDVQRGYMIVSDTM